MDPLAKKLMRELAGMESGRRLRSMSLPRMMRAANWQPAVDVHEGEQDVVVTVELAGVDPKALTVLVDDFQVRISGQRRLVAREAIACVHQLEIEQGLFERVVNLPIRVDGSRTRSRYHQGLLTLVLPKQRRGNRVQITISVEGELP